jgi:hypothetical protein
MGYDAMVIRFEGPDDMRSLWSQNKSFEFVWAGSNRFTNHFSVLFSILDALSCSIPFERSAILTHVIEWNYGDFIGQGSGYDWAYSRWQTPSPPVNSSNIRIFADTLVAYTPQPLTPIPIFCNKRCRYAKQRAAVYQGPVLIPWGAGDARLRRA